MKWATTRWSASALACLLAVGAAARAAAPVYLYNGTDQSWRVQFDRIGLLGAPVALVEVEAATLAESGPRLRVDQEPALVAGEAPSLVLQAGKALRITIHHPAGSRRKCTLWIHGADPVAAEGWQYTFQVQSDRTGAEPRAAIREYYASSDEQLPFGMQALSGTALKLVPRGGEADQSAAVGDQPLKVLKTRSAPACAIL